MPACRVVLYREHDGSVPVLESLRGWESRDRGVAAKCYERLARLAREGHELRRPVADYLRDGLHELRVRKGTTNYRVLYFIAHDGAAVLVHALTKEAAIPEADIRRALSRRSLFDRDPAAHTYEPEGGA